MASKKSAEVYSSNDKSANALSQLIATYGQLQKGTKHNISRITNIIFSFSVFEWVIMDIFIAIAISIVIVIMIA